MATTFSSVVNNYVQTALSARVLGGSSLVVSSTAGLPTLTAGQSFRLSVFRNKLPIVVLKVIGVNFSTNTLTLDGAIEGPDAAVLPNDVVVVGDTAGLINEVHSAINNIETGATHLSLIPTGGITSRTLNDRLSDFYNAKDFGVVGDGITDDSSAINALIGYVLGQPSFKPRTIYFPAGNYAVGSRINIAKSVGSGLQTSSIHLVGDGYQTQFFNLTTLTEIIRIEDSAQGIFEKFRVLCNSPVTVAALHNTAITSGETNSFYNITVDCSNLCPVGIGISLDNDADVAQIQFTECKVSNATKAGYMMGNGISGNVLDLRFLFCQALHCQVGVWMDAAPLIWYGGATTYSTVSDFFISAGCGGPTVIESVRSENSNMLFLSRGGGNIPPTRISDVQCSNFIGQTYDYDDPSQTFSSVGEVVEGFVISHRYSGVMTIMNCSFWHGPSSYPGGRFNIAADCHVAVINCEVGTAGGNATSLRASLYASGGTSGKLNFTALGGKTVTTGGTQFESPIDILCDGPAFFNNTVAINTMAPTAGFHQVGGSFYLQKVPDPVNPPNLTNVGGGSTPYTYRYAYVDESNNRTLLSPPATVNGAATLDGTHYNIVAVPDPGVNIAGVDILRGDTTHTVITDWDPYVSTPFFSYIDSSSGTSGGYSTPVRNETADMVVDGTINISDASGFGVLATGSNTVRTLAQRFTNTVYNVLDWGVKGDGVTDDQPAIMALLKYISNLTTTTSGRRVIYFPAGSYSIGSATNSQGIMIAKRFMQKGDGTYPDAGTQWQAVCLRGDGYSTQFVSNCPTGLTEIMRVEDTSLFRMEGMRFWVHPGMPVTIAALHHTAISSGENRVIEDITVEIQPYTPFAVSLTNGLTPVTGTGTNWDQTLVGKYLLFAGDSTHAAYQIQAVNSTTSITLAIGYGGTTGSTTATVLGEGCPVGMAFSVDYNNDLAQVSVNNCKVTGASYAGFMVGGGIVGNVLDIKFKNCQSSQNAIGVFGWDAPYIWNSGAVTFNYIADFYMNGAAPGPVMIDNVRSEGSNRFYVNDGGGTSFSPTSISNCTFANWGGITYGANLNGTPPFFPTQVSVTNGSAIVTGINTFFVSRTQYNSAGKVAFQNDTTGAVYTISTVDNDTQLTLTTTYSGTTASTFMGLAAPLFTMNTQASVTGSTVVTATNGSAVVTGTSSWTGSLTTNMYLVFASDPNQYFYGIKSVDSSTQVTLDVNAKGNTVFIGPTGLTTVKCGATEAYALVTRCGGAYNITNFMCSHSPKPYLYGRWNMSASQCYVNAIGCSAGAATGTNVNVRDATFLNSGINPGGTNFVSLPGPGNTASTSPSLFANPLGMLVGCQANFQRSIAAGAFFVDPTAGYHQQGGSMRLQALPDPGTAPTVAVQGSPGSTNYYYRFVFRDQAGNVTMSSPSSTHVTTSQPYTSFTSLNFNKITIPFTYQTSNASYVDIIRTTGDGTDGATWVNVVHSATTSSIQFGSTWSWNPWVTNSPTSNSIVFNDQSTTAPDAYTLPTRNLTADLTIDGYLLPTYAGSGGTEINGAQTATIAADATTQKMVQTLWNMSRAKGLIA